MGRSPYFHFINTGLHLRRQSNGNSTSERWPDGRLVNCVTGDGTGECRFPENCGGIVYTRDLEQNLCYGHGFAEQVKCCLIRQCSVPEGKGYCRRTDNGCQDGKFIEGTQDPITKDWPCIGGNDVLCCVKNVDMHNGTSVTSSTRTSLPSSTKTLVSSSTINDITYDSPNNKTVPVKQEMARSSNRAGAIGGAVGAVLACIILLALFFLYRRHQRIKRSQESSLDEVQQDDHNGFGISELRGKSIQNALQDPEKELNTSGFPNTRAELGETGTQLHEIDGKQVPAEIMSKDPVLIETLEPTKSWLNLSKGDASANSSLTNLNHPPHPVR